MALARAIVNEPEVLLLDEPLGALDLKLRQEMQIELKRIQREVGITFVYVTHDQEEALTMSDRLAVFNGGRIEQVGTPVNVYEQPATEFVAGFIGVSNLIDRGRVPAHRPAREGILLVLDGEPAPAGTHVEAGVSRSGLPRRRHPFVVELDGGGQLVARAPEPPSGRCSRARAPAGWRGDRTAFRIGTAQAARRERSRCLRHPSEVPEEKRGT